ncbi:MAG: SDR family oxidoreductase [Deltaproteobacteria bacterium]|nr:SDR family oxidoreductase [Deltaproteobacteria bacterium]MBW2724393.1 SDR family oxidoreductase [Deltaproteobacteria bacterium]
MEVKDKIIVVTGAASGIGKALATRFKAEGAKQIVAVDLNESGAKATADELGCIAMGVDVSSEPEIANVIESTETHVGPIDLFCSNAGIGLAPDLRSPNSEWQKSWEVNVMPHVYAARHLVPRMIGRGGGYFLNTASAAGLLNQIGGAAYGVTKHAAVGFGEWLALTYGHEGIKVSLLCPQAVRTPMIEDGSASAAAAGDGIMEPEELAGIVIEGLRSESFLILPHPEVLEYMRRKTADYDRWIGGMNRLHQRLAGAQ